MDEVFYQSYLTARARMLTKPESELYTLLANYKPDPLIASQGSTVGPLETKHSDVLEFLKRLERRAAKSDETALLELFQISMECHTALKRALESDRELAREFLQQTPVLPWVRSSIPALDKKINEHVKALGFKEGEHSKMNRQSASTINTEKPEPSAKLEALVYLIHLRQFSESELSNTSVEPLVHLVRARVEATHKGWDRIVELCCIELELLRNRMVWDFVDFKTSKYPSDYLGVWRTIITPLFPLVFGVHQSDWTMLP